MSPDPTPRVVVLSPLREGGFRVTITPPLPTGDQARTFWLKEDAYEWSRVLWRTHRCGFHDGTEGRTLRDQDPAE